MTAINAISRGNTAWLLTDTALYDGHGVVQGFGSKSVALPNLGMALAVRGPYSAVGVLASEIGYRFHDFDHFASDGVGHLIELHDQHYGLFEQSGESEFDLVAVGWSNRLNRTDIVVVSSHDHSHTSGGPKPFVMTKHTAVQAPSLSPDERRAYQVPNLAAASIDPVDALLKTVEAQRRLQWPLGSGSKTIGHSVGGAAILTVIDQAGMQMRVLKSWPDKCGQTLNPDTASLHEPVRRALPVAAKSGSIFGKPATVR